MIRVKNLFIFESHNLLIFSIIKNTEAPGKAHYKTILLKTFRYPVECQHSKVINLKQNLVTCTLLKLASLTKVEEKKKQKAGNSSRSRISPLLVKMLILSLWKKQIKDFKRRRIWFQVRIYPMIWNVCHFTYLHLINEWCIVAQLD